MRRCDTPADADRVMTSHAQTAMIATMLSATSAHAIQGTDYQRAGALLQLGQASIPLVFQCVSSYD